MHAAGLPHQQEDKKIGGEKDNGEDVGPVEHGAGKAHRLTIVADARCSGLSRGQRLAANAAGGLAGAYNCSATAADAGPAGAIGSWLADRQSGSILTSVMP